MYFIEKYMGRNLAGSKTLLNIALPKNSYIKADTYLSRNTANLLSGCHIFAYGCSLARNRKGFASFVTYLTKLSDLCQRTLKVPVRNIVGLLPPALRRRNLSKLSQPVTSTRHSLTTSFIVAPLRRFLAGVSVSKKATSPLRRRTASRARSTPFVVSIETDNLWPSL